MTLQYRIAPSLLSCDFAKLGEECQRMLDSGADWLHVDVMDGHFVPNLTLGAPILKCIRASHPKAFLDCHMMVSNPEQVDGQWVEDFAKAGASQYTFHYEVCHDLEGLIGKIKGYGMRVGLAISPDTPLDDNIIKILNTLDMVLVMTVRPGFSGQTMIHECLQKVQILRKHAPNLDIQVDGGITMDNLDSVVMAGANIVVAGTLIFNAPSASSIISEIRSIMNSK